MGEPEIQEKSRDNQEKLKESGKEDVGRPGLEPGTTSLKVRCSTIELPTHADAPHEAGHSNKYSTPNTCFASVRCVFQRFFREREKKNAKLTANRGGFAL